MKDPTKWMVAVTGTLDINILVAETPVDQLPPNTTAVYVVRGSKPLQAVAAVIAYAAGLALPKGVEVDLILGPLLRSKSRRAR